MNIQQYTQDIEKLLECQRAVRTAQTRRELVEILAEVLELRWCSDAQATAAKKAARYDGNDLRDHILEEIAAGIAEVLHTMMDTAWQSEAKPEVLWQVAEYALAHQAAVTDEVAITAVTLQKRAAWDHVEAIVSQALGEPTAGSSAVRLVASWSWSRYWYVGGSCIRLSDHQLPPWHGRPAILEIAISNNYPAADLYLRLPCTWEDVQEFGREVAAAIARLQAQDRQDEEE